MADIELPSGEETTAVEAVRSGVALHALAVLLLLWQNKAIVVLVIGVVLSIVAPASALRYGPSFAFFVVFLLYLDSQQRKKRRKPL